jgi:hypothetical protein
MLRSQANTLHGINFPDSNYWLLARRSISDPTDLAYYLCHAPARTGLTELVTVAGTRPWDSSLHEKRSSGYFWPILLPRVDTAQ